jgi:hypothetical protein
MGEGHKMAPMPTPTLPEAEPMGPSWPLLRRDLASVRPGRIIASLGSQGLMMGSGQDLCI